MKEIIESLIEDAHIEVTYQAMPYDSNDYTPRGALVRELAPKIEALIKAKQREAALLAWETCLVSSHLDEHLMRYD